MKKVMAASGPQVDPADGRETLRVQTSDTKSLVGIALAGKVGHLCVADTACTEFLEYIQFLQGSSMPRGACENCGQHDAFVYAVPLGFGRNLFVCARCLNLPRARENDDEDEGDECDDTRNSGRAGQ